eukprot:GHVN01066418.1.p1 GENE.GHVN01066418.1~~GHVN01066418.1.p1  ORF type:complete len:517 (-),score=35.78 GHVN01066418.1:492-2042(-)
MTCSSSLQESLQWSREVDPSLTRTFVCFTKLDKAESGLSQKILSSEDDADPRGLNLQLGCVAVRCRTKSEVQEGLSFAELLIREEECIDALAQKERGLRALRDEGTYLGLNALSTRLIEIQANRIQCIFPKIVQQVHEAKEHLAAQFRALPLECGSELHAAEMYFTKVHKLQFLFADMFTGLSCLKDSGGSRLSDSLSSPSSTTPLSPMTLNQSLPSRLRPSFHRTLRGYLDDLFVSTRQRILSRVETAAAAPDVRNKMDHAVASLKGQLPPFHAFEPFKRLIRDVLDQWRPDFEADAHAANRIIQDNLVHCAKDLFHGMRALTATISSMIEILMESKIRQCIQDIRHCFAEEFQVYTVNPAYHADLRSRQGERIRNMLASTHRTRHRAASPNRGVDPQPEDIFQQLQLKAHAENALDSVRDAFIIYLEISCQRLCDRIPLIVVRTFCEELVEELYDFLTDRTRIKQYRIYPLLVDDAPLQKKRKALKIQLSQLEEADRICSEDLPDVFDSYVKGA